MAAKPSPQSVVNEPFEIAEDAIEHTTGSRPPQETEPSGTQSGSQTQQAQPALEEKKKVAILTAHRRELDEIAQLQKKRQQDLRARLEEQDKKTEPAPLVEPVPKQKRGVFGGFMGNLRKKQRSVELPKTPTN